MFGEHFQISGFQITRKCILRVKKLKVDTILLMRPHAKPFPRFLMKITHPPSRAEFFRKSVS